MRCVSSCRSAKAATISRLSDFIAPRDSGLKDYVGAFAVTAGIGEDVIAERFKRANDDYSAILVKALADRLAEAFAERLHSRVRTGVLGLCAGRKPEREQISLPKNIAAFARRRVIRHNPITPRKARYFVCSKPSASASN